MIHYTSELHHVLFHGSGFRLEHELFRDRRLSLLLLVILILLLLN